jgi:hypothetical protein
MTTVIYFFLIGLILFIVPQLVVKHIYKEPKIDLNIFFLVLAFALPIIWILLPFSREILNIRYVNFIQHALAGGVAVGFVGIYFINTLRPSFPVFRNFAFQFIFIYALICMFGVANELAEFSLDYLGIGIFSADSYDTWYDLIANTFGGFSLFFVYKILWYLDSKK